MIIAELAEFIQSQGVGTYLTDAVGGDVFCEEMPDKPDEAICLYSTGGMSSDVATSVDRPGASIMIRSAKLRTAQTRAQAVHDLFNRKHNTSFADDGGTHIMLCHCLQTEPISLGQDEKKRYRYVVNLLMITGGN